MVGRDAARVVIVVLSAGRRNSYTRCSKIGIVALPIREYIIGSRHVASTKESDRRLFGRAQAKGVFERPDIAGNKPAVIAPRESGPRAVGLELVAKVCCLLECLIVIDSERRSIDGKEPRTIMPYRGIPLETLDINCVYSKRNAVQFGFLPGDGECDRCRE